MLDHLAVGDPGAVDQVDGHLLAGWGDSPEWTAVGAVEGLAGRDLVALAELVVDDGVQVGKAARSMAMNALAPSRPVLSVSVHPGPWWWRMSAATNASAVSTLPPLWNSST
jgi:hypothetical protein